MECEEGRQLITVAQTQCVRTNPVWYSAFLRNEQTVMPPDLRHQSL